MSDRGLNGQQVSALVEFFNALRENRQVLDPLAWKARAIKINYIVALIPSVWAVGGAFGLDVGLSSEQAVSLLQFLAVIIPIWSNALLAITNKDITLDPKTNQRILQRSLNEHSKSK